ncbi:uncharacterized protein L969DRAFT_95911 [Mixia osmundae IAM 14324]|uniref:Uncharacterized protein n=1 Tax=Mixia osmundae (strain CBS 9802 / IAM 14324 / JCM 22182 / KY 12970) TaxID=764103 RepID=G7DX22_MIXOS|nr:uncharacterized protein L969DRAFT_95911 [Mixia osmundae IAM 14324]KEI38072.1 hypothetical protein L969DRAFT_95911 [Mixia osmundae IAM 14324]GAA95119.1 hypothetical protein E5Q_01774 [Mixia osmundae IAM 14324]
MHCSSKHDHLLGALRLFRLKRLKSSGSGGFYRSYRQSPSFCLQKSCDYSYSSSACRTCDEKIDCVGTENRRRGILLVKLSCRS